MHLLSLQSVDEKELLWGCRPPLLPPAVSDRLFGDGSESEEEDESEDRSDGEEAEYSGEDEEESYYGRSDEEETGSRDAKLPTKYNDTQA